ncbi:MAG: DUF6531 domain-containing protein [Candidatus Eremiobacteraeota bacterium]|nr:DUF6531 domain-containing protein [Candidatus Eremiobacteraeota bacterium]
MTGLRRAISAVLFFVAAAVIVPPPVSGARMAPESMKRGPVSADEWAQAYRARIEPVRILAAGPVPRDTCMPYNPPPPGGAPQYFCNLPDPGATFTIKASVTKVAENSSLSNPVVTCPGATNWTWFQDAVDSTLTVTVDPGSSGSSGCLNEDGPVSTTITRTAVSNVQQTINGKTVGSYTFCYPQNMGGCISGNTEDNLGVRIFNYASTTALPPERPCGRCNGTSIGRPIDVATGELWNEKTDLALSGPFGLSFTRFYGSQTQGTPDLGTGNWLHNYSARLDVSNLFAGNVTYYDYEGMPYYFTSVANGLPSYDSYTGMTLLLSGSTYTLTSFSNQKWTFNAKGELLTLNDRVGNSQTVTRDPVDGHNDRIVSVTDVLQRKLCFYYDTASRITAVAASMSNSPCPTPAPPTSSVTTPVVTLTYDTGTNCFTGALCRVTEPDGNGWTYQYADSSTNTNLTKVLDPLGDPEELNSYSGTKAVHQETGLCSGSPPCNDTGGYINITYPTDGTTNVSIADALGRTSTITYDSNSLLLTKVVGPMCRCGGDQTRAYTYDSYGRVTSAIDDGGDGSHQHTFTYTYSRDANGRAYPGPTSIDENLDAIGTKRRTVLTYYMTGDPRQDLTHVTTVPSIESPGQVVTTTDTYSSSGLLTQRTTTGYVGAISTTYNRSWSYDARGRLLTETGPRTDLGQTTTYGYFADGETDAARAGQLQTITDALGHKTTYAGSYGFTSYDPFGDPQSMNDPNGVTTNYTYDARGRALSSTVLQTSEGEANLVTRLNYDAAGRPTRQILPAGNSTSLNYDTSGRLTALSRLDASGFQHEQLTVAYNAFDQPTSETANVCPNPATTCPAWTMAWGTSYTYASNGDLWKIVNPDATRKQFIYNAQGQVAAFNDENHTLGNNYTYAYDVAGRRLSETRRLPAAPGGSVVTNYTYDLHDNVTAVTDPNGNTTSYHYDDFDRVTKETSPVSGVTTHTYDAANNLTSTSNANGTTATYMYDALDRVLSENDTKGTATASEGWTYDDPTAGNFGIGRLSTMTDPSGSAGLSYDRLGNLQVENKYVAGSNFTYGYYYDVNGNRSEITYPDDTIVLYTFDFADRPYSAQQVGPQDPQSLARRRASLHRPRGKGLAAPYHPARSEMPVRAIGRNVPIVTLPRARTATTPARTVPLSVPRSTTEPAGRLRRMASGTRPDSILVASATYAPFGPLTSMAFGNGTTQTMSYDQRYLPRENKLATRSTTIADHVYSEDALGNIIAISDVLDAGYNRNFAYDDLNRLTTANSGTKLWGTAAGNGHTYDAMGNMTGMNLGTTVAQTFAYQPGGTGSRGLPLLKSVTNNGTVLNIASDAIGSMTADGANTYAYGARELLGYDLPNIQSYAYDGFRRRVQSQLPDGTQRASFFDPDDHLLAESVLSVLSPTTIAYDYIWFGDKPVAQVDSTSTHWTFADHLGTPLAQTDVNGAISWQGENQPYGKLGFLRAGDVHQPLRFPGQTAEQFDAGPNGLTQLSYNNARWYRAEWGRYTQNDPMQMDRNIANATSSAPFVEPASSSFGYGNWNPLNNTDFVGLDVLLGINPGFPDLSVGAGSGHDQVIIFDPRNHADAERLSWVPNTNAPIGGLAGSVGHFDNRKGNLDDLMSPATNDHATYTWFYIRTTRKQEAAIRGTFLAAKRDHFNLVSNNCAVVIQRGFRNSGNWTWLFLSGVPRADYETLTAYGFPVLVGGRGANKRQQTQW